MPAHLATLVCAAMPAHFLTLVCEACYAAHATLGLALHDQQIHYAGLASPGTDLTITVRQMSLDLNRLEVAIEPWSSTCPHSPCSL